MASAHVNVDNNSAVRSVRDEDVAYAAPGSNHDGLHVEFAGYAAQRAEEWNDPFSKAMLFDIAVPVFGRWCEAYEIPAVLLNEAGLKAQRRGITTHAEVSRAFRLSSHTDPGPNFPLGKFVGAVREFRGGKAEEGEPVRKPLATIKVGTGRNWLVKKAQRHLRVHGVLAFEGKPDGDFDSKVQAAVERFQRGHGISVDGIIGPDTWRKLQT